MPLRAGEAAPWAGQLLSNELALALGQGAEGCTERVQLALNRAKDDCTIELARINAAHVAEQAAMAAELARANAAAERARKVAAQEAPPWFSAPWFVGTLTAVVTASVVTFATAHSR